MKNHTVLLLILLFSFSVANGQRIPRHTTDEGNVYPIITMNAIISMYDMAIADWERNMKLISKVRDDYGQEGVAYTIQNKDGTGDGWCFVTKKPDAIEIAYNLGTNKTSLFTDLMRDLKEYYVSDVENHQVYSFKHLEDPEYIFLVSQTPETEYVRMYVNNQEAKK